MVSLNQDQPLQSKARLITPSAHLCHWLLPTLKIIHGMSGIKKMINRSRLKCGTRCEPSLKKLPQIGTYEVANWLQHYILRKVQYMTGHKYVSSTERYRTDNLEDLQKEVENYHPLK